MSDVTHQPSHGDAHAGSGEHIHLPSNSWTPISLALAICMCLLGLLSATWVWVIGLIWAIASGVIWVRGSRAEFRELPDHH
jgi:hypothetical protein